MHQHSPSARDVVRRLCQTLAVLAFLAGLAATTVGGSAVATLTLTGPPQPFAPIAGIAAVAASAADAASVSVAVAVPDSMRRVMPVTSRSDEASGLPWQSDVIAHAAGVPLFSPSEHVKVIGYHQAASAAAFPWEPRGAPFTNRNVPAYHAPVSEGPDYAVLANRRRGTLATTAVDIAMPHNTTVFSPVNGTVATVSPYLLYGRVPDLIVTVIPDGRPDLRMVIIHINGVLVEPGQHLVAGQTPLARTAMQFPFYSQIDELAGPGPHIHVEVRPA